MTYKNEFVDRDWSHLWCRIRLNVTPKEDIEPLMQQMAKLHPKASPSEVAGAALRPWPLPTYINPVTQRPGRGRRKYVKHWLPTYLESALKLKLADVADLLEASIKHSRYHRMFGENLELDKFEYDGRPIPAANAFQDEEACLHVVTKAIMDGTNPRTRHGIWALFTQLARYMEIAAPAFARHATVSQNDDALTLKESKDQEDDYIVLAALVDLLCVVAENNKLQELLTEVKLTKGTEDIRSWEVARISLRAFNEGLSKLLPVLVPVSLDYANRLDSFQKQYLRPFKYGIAEDDGSDFYALMPNPQDVPDAKSRAGIYVFLESMLAGRPFIDDHVLLNFLNTRYKEVVPNMLSDFIVASFDILANASFRNEANDLIQLRKSFLINKLPLILLRLSSSLVITFPEVTIESCIAQALNRVDRGTFPVLSAMFDSITDMSESQLMDVRQDFICACCLHGLVQESSIETLLGEIPMQTLPAGGRYVKQQLVIQCSNDTSQLQKYVGEIERTEGNSGAICSAIGEVIRGLCAQKDTAALKTVCSELSRRPQSLDVLFLFEKLASVLGPICALLDGWTYDDEQTEDQLVYEEFGMVFLLVLVCVRRYNLKLLDLVSSSYQPAATSFIAQTLKRNFASETLEDLTVDRRSQLGDWIRGLYESEGISDELLHSCGPQDFYALVPTLFHQSIMAVSTGSITFEVFQGGLEYLLGSMLIPSLVPALFFLSSYLWKNQNPNSKDSMVAILKTLAALIRPASSLISGDAELVHPAILNVTGKTIETSLSCISQVGNGQFKKEIDSLIQSLQPHLSFPRNDGATSSELDSWCANPQANGPHKPTNSANHPPTVPVQSSLTSTVRSTFQNLITWSISREENFAPPTSYSHKLITLSTELIGADAVLDLMAHAIRQLQVAADNAVINGALNAQQNSQANVMSFDVAVSIIISISSAQDFENRYARIYHVEPQLRPSPSAMSLYEALKLRVGLPPPAYKSGEPFQEIHWRYNTLRRLDFATSQYFVAPAEAPPPDQVQVPAIIPVPDAAALMNDSMVEMGLPRDGGPGQNNGQSIIGGDENMLDLGADLGLDGGVLGGSLLDDFGLGGDDGGLGMDLDL